MDAFEQLGKTFFDWEAMVAVLPDLLTVGLPNTLLLALASGIIGTIAGMILAIMGISRNRVLRWIARIYTDIFRGLPAVVIILLIGLGLGPVLREITGSTSPYPLGILALSLIASAYIGEIFRSGIQSVEKGQLEASRALGFSYGSSMQLVVVPQGVRRVLPALVNQFISLIKESSLIYFIGLVASERELFRVGNDAASNTGNLSPLIAAGVFYLCLTIPLTHLVNFIDTRLRVGRKQKPEPDDPAAMIPTSGGVRA
ncbi:amino acid ABC transporter permease [Arthrobacter agilis]|uniref:amino acid ABC transporter permease n=1 Tax=Arthrobacter agilis TaxID=37921 RepID=UPI000B3582C4|nr:amino acid ABC transporter permease [Arthrobacter agilis]OUM43102.1 amino acid ABC transporter permease [Arthrobacter agilis]PPB46046.1 amino acid ABC transporter permease [Arthrobacter agilis]TPV25588.1 amino acid ABC transporter permease [Arthrobacter agilis]VDR33356.1 Arginine transport system permease protein ArtQ [Arthrobacter agilis]